MCLLLNSFIHMTNIILGNQKNIFNKDTCDKVVYIKVENGIINSVTQVFLEVF